MRETPNIDNRTSTLPLVTVTVPLYNKAKYVLEALESIRLQEYPNMEVVVIDDRSTDNSHSIVKEYLTKIGDDRFSLMRNDNNLGLQGNGNRCLEVGSGKYIVRLDADDKMPPKRIEKQVQFMEENPEMGASGGYNRLLGSGDRIYKMPLEADKIDASFIFQTPISQGTSIIRRPVVMDNGLRYDEAGPSIGEDWLFFYKISRLSQVGNIPEVLNEYRHYSGNASRSYDEQYYSDVRSVLKYILNDRGLELTSREIDLHMMLRNNFTIPCDRKTVIELDMWCDKLVTHFKGEPIMIEEIERRRARAFENMYFHLKLFDLSGLLALIRRVRPKMNHIRYRIGAMAGRMKTKRSNIDH